jgi:hypothetical protein
MKPNCISCKHYEYSYDLKFVKCKKKGSIYIFDNQQGTFRHGAFDCYEPTFHRKMLNWFLNGGSLLIFFLFAAGVLLCFLAEWI